MLNLFGHLDHLVQQIKSVFFSGIKLSTYFTHEPSCLVFAMFPYRVINWQGLPNILGLLAVRLNELQTALLYNNKI